MVVTARGAPGCRVDSAPGGSPRSGADQENPPPVQRLHASTLPGRSPQPGTEHRRRGSSPRRKARHWWSATTAARRISRMSRQRGHPSTSLLRHGEVTEPRTQQVGAQDSGAAVHAHRRAVAYRGHQRTKSGRRRFSTMIRSRGYADLVAPAGAIHDDSVADRGVVHDDSVARPIKTIKTSPIGDSGPRRVVHIPRKT
jgi:hypothetical protein